MPIFLKKSINFEHQPPKLKLMGFVLQVFGQKTKLFNWPNDATLDISRRNKNVSKVTAVEKKGSLDQYFHNKYGTPTAQNVVQIHLEKVQMHVYKWTLTC